MTWPLAHWKALSVAAGLAVAFGAGWWVRGPPPQPAVSLREDTALQKAATQATAKTDQKAAGSTVRKVYRTDCAPGSPPVLASETVIRRGPEVIDTRSQSASTERLDQHLDLTVTPAAPPRWALGAGIEDPLGARKLRVEAGMRLLGPVWLRAGLAPARGLGSATVGLEVTW